MPASLECQGSCCMRCWGVHKTHSSPASQTLLQPSALHSVHALDKRVQFSKLDWKITPNSLQQSNCSISSTAGGIWNYCTLGHLNIICFVLGRFNLRPSVLWCCWLGGRKGIRPVKNWAVGCWHGYLSGARCRLAYGPADATVTHCRLLQ